MVRWEFRRFWSFTSSISDFRTVPGLAMVSPRARSLFRVPARFTATRCPAKAVSTSFPWTCKFRTRAWKPVGSTSAMSPTANAPSMRVPVTTVPKPSTENTRSMGRRKGERRFFSAAARMSSRNFSRSSGMPSPV